MPKLVTMQKDTCRADFDQKAVASAKKQGWSPVTSTDAAAAKGTKKTAKG
jgi:hypothetical protein